jgi:hypothetical protein
VLLAILIYVTLDLSLPMMPGAFVFEPEGSVESIQLNRGRAGNAELIALPALPSESSAPSRSRIDVRRRMAPRRGLARLTRHPVASRLPRATLDPAPSSDDPH